MTLAQLLLFLPAAALVAASPGANNLLAFANGSRHGFLLAVVALLGRCSAFALLIAMVIGGLGALLEASEATFQAIKWGGVLYLIYLGIQMMRSKGDTQAEGEAGSRSPLQPRAPRISGGDDQSQGGLAVHGIRAAIDCAGISQQLHISTCRSGRNLCRRGVRRGYGMGVGWQ